MGLSGEGGALLTQLRNRCTEDGQELLKMLVNGGGTIGAHVMKQAVQQEGICILKHLAPYVSDFKEQAPLALSETAWLNNFQAVEFPLREGMSPNSFVAIRQDKLSVIAIATSEWDEETTGRQRRPAPSWKMMEYLAQYGAGFVVREQDLDPFSFLRYLLHHASSKLFIKTKIIAAGISHYY
jgi:hypothetical protein